MNSSRREKIEAMLAEDPDDVFLRYSLALEWASEDEPQKSLEGLRQLMQQRPPYAPAFPLASRILVGLGRTAEARQVLQEGIECARQHGDTHAVDKMEESLAALGGPLE